MSKDYGSWSLADLKSELRRRNAKVNGKKAVLVQRLEDYDKLFGPLITDPESAFKIIVPSAEFFIDVTSESAMPALTEADLKRFCVLSERENVETSLNMYQEGFIISCRSAHEDGVYYIKGLCASEMRKQICYNVTIKAKNNIILEAQCECAAGIGPYAQCKHVIVFMYGIVEFNQNKTLKTKLSCTSSLQTFNHPRSSYSGNPVLAENLKLRLNDQKLKEMTKFDPRPTDGNTEKYNENFRSLIANYCGIHGSMPIAQIIKPADKRSVFRDHDYLNKTAEEQFLDSKLSKEELLDVQKRTSDNVKEWMQERKLRLQSSDFGRICKQKTNLYQLAKSLATYKELHAAPAIKHGIKYEPVAIKKFEEMTGVTVKKCGIIVHPQHQFLGCTPDGLVEEFDEVLEIKCPFSAKNKEVSVESVPYLYLCEKTGKIKLNNCHDYYYQIQGQLFCSQKNVANLCIYTISDCYVIKIHRDEKFIKEMLIHLKSFYEIYYKKVLLNKFLYR